MTGYKFKWVKKSLTQQMTTGVSLINGDKKKNNDGKVELSNKGR